MAEVEEVARIVENLAAAPGRYEAAFSRMEDADSVTHLGQGEWTPVQVLAHVRATHDILEHRIYAVLARDMPQLNAYDDARWAQVARYETVPVLDSLQIMHLRRRELTRALSAISLEDWELTGIHEITGKLSVLQIARHLANHDDEHIAQIEGAGPGR